MGSLSHDTHNRCVQYTVSKQSLYTMSEPTLVLELKRDRVAQPDSSRRRRRCTSALRYDQTVRERKTNKMHPRTRCRARRGLELGAEGFRLAFDAGDVRKFTELRRARLVRAHALIPDYDLGRSDVGLAVRAVRLDGTPEHAPRVAFNRGRVVGAQ